jgi:hypothetical protein
VIVDRRVEIRHGDRLPGVELPAKLLVLSLEKRASAQPVDRAILRGATRASCARSSARPTSRTIRARPAMSRGDSIRQTASIVRWVSEAATAPD